MYVKGCVQQRGFGHNKVLVFITSWKWIIKLLIGDGVWFLFSKTIYGFSEKKKGSQTFILKSTSHVNFKRFEVLKSILPLIACIETILNHTVREFFQASNSNFIQILEENYMVWLFHSFGLWLCDMYYSYLASCHHN